MQCFPISETELLFRRFQSFGRVAFWYGQHVDEEEYGALMV
jgi:hypothetical protein